MVGVEWVDGQGVRDTVGDRIRALVIALIRYLDFVLSVNGEVTDLDF